MRGQEALKLGGRSSKCWENQHKAKTAKRDCRPCVSHVRWRETSCDMQAWQETQHQGRSPQSQRLHSPPGPFRVYMTCDLCCSVFEDGGSVVHDGRPLSWRLSLYSLNCGLYVSTFSTSAFCEGRSTSQDTELLVLLSNLSRKSEPPPTFFLPLPQDLTWPWRGEQNFCLASLSG